MKKLICSLLVFSSSLAFAETYTMNAVMEKATEKERSDLPGLLKAARMKPETDPKTGKAMMKVVSVEKGSVYDRLGVKPGDYFETNNAPGKKTELKQSLKSVTNKEVK